MGTFISGVLPKHSSGGISTGGKIELGNRAGTLIE